MGFTTVAFIRRNTPELRKKLKELGYYAHPNYELIYQQNKDYTKGALYTGRGFYANNPIGYEEEVKGSIDCGDSETLFLAIAALRDDTDKFQWFTDSYHWEICPDEVAYINAWIDKYEYSPHKATVEELIEHFRGKEE